MSLTLEREFSEALVLHGPSYGLSSPAPHIMRRHTNDLWFLWTFEIVDQGNRAYVYFYCLGETPDEAEIPFLCDDHTPWTQVARLLPGGVYATPWGEEPPDHPGIHRLRFSFT